MLDSCLVQHAKAHPDRGKIHRLEAGVAAHDGQRRLEHHDTTAHALELSACPRVVAGLADGLPVEVGHLVRADHHRMGVATRDRMRLLQREPSRER